jgi:hypothetical protein
MNPATARLLRRYARERLGAHYTPSLYRRMKRQYAECTAAEKRDIGKFVRRFHDLFVDNERKRVA